MIKYLKLQQKIMWAFFGRKKLWGNKIQIGKLKNCVSKWNTLWDDIRLHNVKNRHKNKRMDTTLKQNKIQYLEQILFNQ